MEISNGMKGVQKILDLQQYEKYQTGQEGIEEQEIWMELNLDLFQVQESVLQLLKYEQIRIGYPCTHRIL